MRPCAASKPGVGDAGPRVMFSTQSSPAVAASCVILPLGALAWLVEFYKMPVMLSTGLFLEKQRGVAMRCSLGVVAGWCVSGFLASAVVAEEEPLFVEPIRVDVPKISSDPNIKYDYDIVYVRAKRAGDTVHKRFYTDFSQPVTMEPGADLMLLHPDGSEELLAEGGDGGITDPVISFDGQSVYYTHIYQLKGVSQWSPSRQGADIFKLHLPTRKIVQLTDQRFYPNTGAGDWAEEPGRSAERKNYYDYGVFNMGPCPLPGGRLAFTSNRDGFRPSKGYPAIALQLFVMDDSDTGLGQNVEKIGHLNLAGALHPVVLADGRIMFSTLESQGIRSEISWGIWTIHPDGTNWGPMISAFDPGGASNGFHFQAQRSDGSVIIEEYYNQNNSGFGAYIKLPPEPPAGYSAFGPAYMRDDRNPGWRFGRFDNGKGKWYRMPFMPTGSTSFTPFTLNGEGEADPSILGEKKSPKVGKFTHPSAAPDNTLLTVYSPGPVNHQYTFLPQLDGGIYLIPGTGEVNEPADLRLIKNDPEYNESWPRAVVPYRRMFGIEAPRNLPRLANAGQVSPHLPAGTPFGLVGASSLYKRESYPNGVVKEGEVTATYAGGNDPWKGLDAFTSHGNGMPLNWHNQGGDVGLYSNDEIHALRILVMEPTTDRHRGPKSGRQFYNHAHERLRILGEIPVRKFSGEMQPLDPDGNPDTSFLARIPGDTAFTFQTLDVNGVVLNMSQTWHQLRPGEIRTNCGGCHAHSQKPTEFSDTLAAKPDYKLWDLVKETPLVVDQARDRSGQRWDAARQTGLASAEGPVNVEYHRHIRPILERSCVACHTKSSDKPAGNLVLDADVEQVQIEHHGKFPGTYVRLALDERAVFGFKPVGYDSWGYPNASRYIRKFQSRRSLLTWKIFGRRMDGFSNDEHPSEFPPGSRQFMQRGEPVDVNRVRHAYDLDYIGSPMPPEAAVAGTFVGPGGKLIHVPALTDEDRRTLVRWIDLGCPIDLDYDPALPDRRGFGWMCDDNRPVLTITSPLAKGNARVAHILIGMHDYDTGLDLESFTVTANREVNGRPAGENLAPLFESPSPGVKRLALTKPWQQLDSTQLTVSVRDRQGNTSRIERVFRVGSAKK